MRIYILPLIVTLGLAGCAPCALYFHETTKVGFSADYNTADSHPISTNFGFKRRIVAVVPSQERVMSEGGSERNATNNGEALSLVSKFSVRAGTSEGIAIVNNFASGMAARIMTQGVGSSSDSLKAMMHSPPISVNSKTGNVIKDGIDSGKPATAAVNDRVVEILAGRRSRSHVLPPSSHAFDDKPASEAPVTPAEEKSNRKLPPSTGFFGGGPTSETPSTPAAKKNNRKLPPSTGVFDNKSKP